MRAASHTSWRLFLLWPSPCRDLWSLWSLFEHSWRECTVAVTCAASERQSSDSISVTVCISLLEGSARSSRLSFHSVHGTRVRYTVNERFPRTSPWTSLIHACVRGRGCLVRRATMARSDGLGLGPLPRDADGDASFPVASSRHIVQSRHTRHQCANNAECSAAAVASSTSTVVLLLGNIVRAPPPPPVHRFAKAGRDATRESLSTGTWKRSGGGVASLVSCCTCLSTLMFIFRLSF